MINQDTEAAPQDVKNLKPLGDDETHSPSISPFVNNENNIDKSISETMPVETTTNHELQDQGDTLSKLTPDGANLLDKHEVSSSKLEDEKENKIEDKTELVEMSTSSPLEQVDNPNKNQDLADNNDIPETESPKTLTNSETVKDGVKVDDNVNGNDSHDDNDNVDSRDRSCSTTSDKTSDSKNGQKTRCKPDGQESQSQLPLVKDAKTLVSQVSEVAQESEADTVKGFSGFDLNQEVCSEEEEVDNPINPVSSTISAASGLSSTPLQSEGFLKPIIPDGTHNDSKQQRLDCLAFDLNAADGCEDKTLPSGEESSVGPTKMQLDLNSIMDEGCDARWQSPSRSSSSSSKQTSLKNIDLNLSDQPESVVCIFGSNFGVKKNNPPAQPSVSNLGPTEAAMFFPTPMYGSHGMPIPYMVDSRGSPIVPQMPISFPQHPSPFLMNMGPAGSSGLGPSHHNFDLNTGLLINGGNRETNSVLRQFLPQNSSEQYSRTSSPSGSIVGGKRHVPDSGWDFFPASKHQQQPWR